MEADFSVTALEEAITRHGAPEIVNIDQGSQFAGTDCVAAVKGCGARHSMDGLGCWRDNVFVERLWRSVKYEIGRRSARCGRHQANGSISRTPVPAKSRTLRVTSVMPCSSAVAAITESRQARGLGTCRGAQSRAPRAVKGSVRLS